VPERMTRPPACLVRNVRAATVRVRRAAAATKPATGEPSVAAARMACISTRPNVERGSLRGAGDAHGLFARLRRTVYTPQKSKCALPAPASLFEVEPTSCCCGIAGGVGERGKGVEHCGGGAAVR